MKPFIKTLTLVIVILLMQNNTNAQDVKKVDEVKILTSAVCGMCKDRIEQNIAFESGVKDVVLDIDSKIVTIKYKTSKTNPDKLRLALSKLGYDADNVVADKVAYEKLPPCCKKGNAKH
ncbi:MAG: heavy-metal-associated domain-containing protein [Bacteroidota bacterium]